MGNKFKLLYFLVIQCDIEGEIEKKSGLVGQGITFRFRGFQIQTPLGAHPGFETRPCYKAPSDLWVEIIQDAVIKIRLVRLPARQWHWGKTLIASKEFASFLTKD